MSETKSKKLIIHLTPSMHGAIKARAADSKVSMAEYVRATLIARQEDETLPPVRAEVLAGVIADSPREY
jgi:hypothetical protein